MNKKQPGDFASFLASRHEALKTIDVKTLVLSALGGQARRQDHNLGPR